MKQIVQWMASSFAMLLVLSFGAGVQSVNAQELAEGYYYINTTVSDYAGQGLCWVSTDKTPDRVHARVHNAGRKVTKEDLPFVFKFTKAEDGEHYTIQNFVNKKYFGRFADAEDTSPGGGLGYVDEATNFSVVEQAGGYSMEYAGDRYPKYGGVVHAQNDWYAGFWGDATNIYSHKVWSLVPVDEESLFNPVEVTEIDGNTENGYYYINFDGLEDATTCMVPVQDGDLWRLGAYPREEAEFDPTFVWHITKNADGTYALKNLGAQDLTFIETVGKGEKESPYILMTGVNPASFTFKYMSDGSIYIYTTDNAYNFSVSSDGNMCTLKAQNTNSSAQFVPVPAEKITNALKLNAAITTALGKQFTVGTNPGQVSQEDYDTFNAVLEKAQAAKGSEDDNSALIAELNEATEALQGKIIPVEEGYYTFKNGENDVYLKPYFRDNIWYLGHDAVDPFMDASAVWHVVKNADGNLVLKNCGTQDSTYIKSNASGNNWGFVQMSGTSKTYNTFKQQYSNVFKLYASDNGNFWNADGGNRISSNNDYHPLDGVWYIEKVTGNDIPYFTKLNEAITDAAGTVKDANIGPNPGDNLGDATELNEVINAARTMYDEASASDSEVDDMIAKLEEAVKNFNEQDHSMRGIDDGYYYIVSTQDGFQRENRKIAMYVPSTTDLSWKAIEERNGQFLFNIKNLGDGTYSIQNVEFLRYVGSNSANGVATTAEQTVPQKFEYNNGTWLISNTVDNGVYTLKTYKTESTGVININDASGIKTWTLKRELNQAVIDSIAENSAPVRLRQDLINALQKAEPAYKGVFKYVTDRNDGLLKEVNEDNPLDGQIWGTQVNDTYTSYAHLIDGDLNTCFQSSWDGGTWGSTVEEGKGQQWLQVDLRSNPVDNFEFYFGLRNGDWGWKECWSNIDIYATNDAGIASQETLNAADWTYVGNYKDLTSYIKPDDANMNSNGRYIYYSIRDLDQAYRYIRFMVRSTIVPQACMMYTIGEFQVYKTIHDADNDPYNYVEGLKPLVDELKQLIDDGNKLIDENGTVTQDVVDRMKELTEQVVALTPNTEPLDTRIAEVKAYVEKFGDNDEWGDVTSEQYEAIISTTEDAESYDHERPTVGDLDARLAALNEAFDLYKSQQKQPEAGTWYYISNMDQERAGYAEDGDGGTGSDVYSRFCYGNVILAPTTNATRDAYWSEWTNAVKWGGYDHASATRDESIATNPYAMWRLVNMDVEGENDTFYALQNRATGLYLGKYGNKSGTGGMSTEPVPYRVVLCKSGAFFFNCADKVANSDNIPLHADGRRILVSWGSGENGPSSWTLEPVDEEVENLEIDIPNNAATIIALPYAYGDQATVSLNADNGVVTYGIKGVSEDGSKLLLYKKDNFAAGEPMIVVAGEIGNAEGDADATVKMFLPLANEYSLVSAAANGLVGVFDYTLLPANVGVIQGDSIVATEENVTALFGQRGYIDASQITNMEGVETDLTLKIKGDIVNGITIVPAAATGKVNVYTTDGVLVKKNVNAANAKDGLKKGVYIIGRDKVLVK